VRLPRLPELGAAFKLRLSFSPVNLSPKNLCKSH
jgi:hypothetical protein